MSNSVSLEIYDTRISWGACCRPYYKHIGEVVGSANVLESGLISNLGRGGEHYDTMVSGQEIGLQGSGADRIK